MPTERYNFGDGVANGIIYAVGGTSPASVFDATVDAYDPTTNSWTTRTPMLTGRYGLGVSVVNGILYAVGGFAALPAGVTATVEAYQP